MPFRLRARLARVRDLFDGMMHDRRREAARERLRGLRPRSILFVCLGNVCRSPYAAWSARSVFEGQSMSFDSAGFIGPGRHPADRAVEAARERGIHHGENRSQIVTPELVRRHDAVVLFQTGHARRLRRVCGPSVDRERVFQLGDFDPRWAGTREVPDPWGEPLEEFRATFERIDRCLRTMDRDLGGPGIRTDPGSGRTRDPDRSG